MLTAEQIAALRDYAGRLTDPINDYLIRDIAERIAKAGQFTSTAQYQIWAAQQMGLSQVEIKKRLKKLLGVSNDEIKKLLTQSAEVGYRFDLKALPTADAIPFAENHVLQEVVSAAVKLAQDDFTNITQTIGMVDPYGRVLPLQQAYRSSMDFAFSQVATGAADYNTAVRLAVKNLAEKGIQTIDYQSGIHTSLEAAVRRSVMGGLGLMQEQISKQTHDDLGANGWEISAHAASAPDHEPIQGKQYSDEEYEKLNNSLVRRIGTLNCGHAAFPIILGVTPSQYTREELEKYRLDNERGLEYEGKHYTMYEATQRQRRLEASMRRQKRRILADEATGNQEKKQQDQIKLQILNQEYRRFSKAAGLRTQNAMAEAAGFSANQGLKIIANTVDVSSKSATMNVQNSRGDEIVVHQIGRIDPEKYSAVSNQIRTDEVVITDERIEHIRERHPNDFERYSQYMSQMLISLQYILEDPVPNTAVLLQEFSEKDERFRLILRLAVVGDDPYKKNSVITFLKISEKKFRKYIRNKKILYKSE